MTERLTTGESLWQDMDDAQVQVLTEVEALRAAGQEIEADTLLLSGYISTEDESLDTSESNAKFKQEVLTAVENLRSDWSELSHTQLDVLLNWYIKYPPKDLDALEELLPLADREVELSEDINVPHQRALAYTTRGRLKLLLGQKSSARGDADSALLFREDMMHEDDQLQGLRQLVRVLRHVGEIYDSTDISPMPFYMQALELAEGPADTKDQARKIRDLLEKRKEKE